MLSKSPGEIFEPVTATRTGWKACRGFRPSPSAAARSAASIDSAVNGSSEVDAGEVTLPADAVLPKPFTIEALTETVRTLTTPER